MSSWRGAQLKYRDNLPLPLYYHPKGQRSVGGPVKRWEENMRLYQATWPDTWQEEEEEEEEKVKANLAVCLTKHHATKYIYGGT